MREAVIVEGIRTAIGKRNGQFKDIRPDDLGGFIIKELVMRVGIDPTVIEDVIFGCVSQVGEQAGDIARISSLIAGLPIEVPGVTIDRRCGSSQQAIHFAAQAILSGDMDVVIAGGVESMSRVPIGSNVQGVKPSELLSSSYDIIHQGLSAEKIAQKYALSREEMDEFAFSSHRKAINAQQQGAFSNEIIPMTVGETGICDKDEGPRVDTSMEDLSSLNSVFKENGSVTAGNSSQISDGAAALLIMEKKTAEQLGLKPRFLIHTRSVIGSDPTYMLLGSIEATKKALYKSSLTIDDMDVFEINEAFASVVLAWQKETGANLNKVNPYGGAIALGHPLGASGARLMLSMMTYLEATGGRYGLQSMCEGYGMANATIIERL